MKISKLMIGALLGCAPVGWAQAQATIDTAFAKNRPEIAADREPGSVLIFPKFDVSTGWNTRIRITNILDLKAVAVELNYVCPGVKNVNQQCKGLNRRIKLTPHQTRVIDVAAQNPPCAKGFIVAFALDPWRLNPISFNYLIGSYNIIQGSEDENDNAIAIQSPQKFLTPLSGRDGLKFGKSDYGFDTVKDTQRLPDYLSYGTELFTDFRAISSNATSGSNLVLLSLDTLAGQQNPPTLVNIDFWNSSEVPFSTSLEFVCWAEVQLDNIDVNFRQANLETEYGSMDIATVPNCPWPGGCPPFHQYDPVILGEINEWFPGYQEGRTLMHDTYPKSTTFVPN